MTVRSDVFMQTCGWNATPFPIGKKYILFWISDKSFPRLSLKKNNENPSRNDHFGIFSSLPCFVITIVTHLFFCRIYFFKNIFSSIFLQTISKETFSHNISQSEMPHTRSQWSKQKHFFVYLTKSSLASSVKAPLLCKQFFIYIKFAAISK